MILLAASMSSCEYIFSSLYHPGPWKYRGEDIGDRWLELNTVEEITCQQKERIWLADCPSPESQSDPFLLEDNRDQVCVQSKICQLRKVRTDRRYSRYNSFQVELLRDLEISHVNPVVVLREFFNVLQAWKKEIFNCPQRIWRWVLPASCSVDLQKFPHPIYDTKQNMT